MLYEVITCPHRTFNTATLTDAQHRLALTHGADIAFDPTIDETAAGKLDVAEHTGVRANQGVYGRLLVFILAKHH